MARNTNGEGFSLKDELFNQTKVRWLASQFEAADSSFNARLFETQVMQKLGSLELKARIAHIADVLERHLDSDFVVAAKQIKAALPPALDPTNTDDDFGGFILAPLGDYVVRHGCTSRHLDRSLKLLKELTKRFSMEFYIRPFLDAFPAETLAMLADWSLDHNYHVRRLVSEGTRPLLPWAGRLQTITYQAPLTFLDTLHTDNTRYVTRSVANHLNDISKRDAPLVIATLKRWQDAKQPASTELAWMLRQALRTLVKQGNQDALTLLGYHHAPPVVVGRVTRAPAKLALGDALTFSFSLTAKRDEKLLIDYVVDFVKKNGTTAPKVFTLKKLQLAAGETVTLTKRHLIKANSSTFTYYPGVHTVTLQINGRRHASFTFILTN